MESAWYMRAWLLIILFTVAPVGPNWNQGPVLLGTVERHKQALPQRTYNQNRQRVGGKEPTSLDSNVNGLFAEQPIEKGVYLYFCVSLSLWLSRLSLLVLRIHSAYLIHFLTIRGRHGCNVQKRISSPLAIWALEFFCKRCLKCVSSWQPCHRDSHTSAY